MSHQIILQPDGKFAIWSDSADDPTQTNMTDVEVMEYHGEKAKLHAMQNVANIISELREGGKPYFQFTQNWELIQQRKSKKDD